MSPAKGHKYDEGTEASLTQGQMQTLPKIFLMSCSQLLLDGGDLTSDILTITLKSLR